MNIISLLLSLFENKNPIPEIKYIRVQEKMLLGAKRNLMHKHATGDILVYMDDDGRNSTVLTSETNTQFIPVKASRTRNYLKATINSLAPPWASRYKFGMQVSQGDFETIYIQKFAIYANGNPSITRYYLPLLGENQTKGVNIFC